MCAPLLSSGSIPSFLPEPLLGPPRVQVVDFALDSGASIVDVDGNNEPLFTAEAKRQWLKDKSRELSKAISNPFEESHEHPLFKVRVCVWRVGSIGCAGRTPE